MNETQLSGAKQLISIVSLSKCPFNILEFYALNDGSIVAKYIKQEKNDLKKSERLASHAGPDRHCFPHVWPRLVKKPRV